MDFLTWILLGLVVGAVAIWLDPYPTIGGGIISSILLGIVGALVGGFLGLLIFGYGVNGINFYSVVMSVLGALLVMWIVRRVRNNRQY